MQESCQPTAPEAPRGGVSAGRLYIGNSTRIPKKILKKIYKTTTLDYDIKTHEYLLELDHSDSLGTSELKSWRLQDVREDVVLIRVGGRDIADSRWIWVGLCLSRIQGSRPDANSSLMPQSTHD